MNRERLIAEFGTPQEAKKVEETVKTGYGETIIETLVQWIAAEEDLASTYSGLSTRSASPQLKAAYEELGEESRRNTKVLSELLGSFEGLDRARVLRIERLRDAVS